MYYRTAKTVFGPVNGGSPRRERWCVGATMKIYPARVGGGRHWDMERWGNTLYEGREARGFVNKPHATLDGI